MAITQDDFKKVWASTSSVPEYTFSDTDYKNGWEFVGNLPPTRAMWDELQRKNDEKMQFLQENGSMCFDSVTDMKSSNLDAGQTAFTKGYYSINDGGSGTYSIRGKVAGEEEDGGSVIFLANGNVAELITDGLVTPEQFGAYGDGVHDDTIAINKAVVFANEIHCSKSYYIHGTINFYQLHNKKFYGGIFYAEPIENVDTYVFSLNKSENIYIHDIVIHSDNSFPSHVNTEATSNWNNSVSSNRNGFNVYGCTNILIENISSTNLRMEVHVNGNTVEENNPSKNIKINNYYSIGNVGSSFFVGFTDGYLLSNVKCIPSDKPIPATHFLYMSAFNRNIKVDNVFYVGNSYHNCILNLYVPTTPQESPTTNLVITNSYFKGPYLIGINQWKSDFVFENCVFEDIIQNQSNETQSYQSMLQFAIYSDGDVAFRNCQFICAAGTNSSIMAFRTNRTNDLKLMLHGCSFVNAYRLSYTYNNFTKLSVRNCAGNFTSRVWSDNGAFNYSATIDSCDFMYSGDRCVALVGTGTQEIILKNNSIKSNVNVTPFYVSNANGQIKMYNDVINNTANPVLTSGEVKTFNVVYNDVLVNNT